MAKGLLINLDRCTGCDSCIVACKLENRLPLGSFYNKVIAIGPTGTFPDVEKYWLPSQCQQCENPQCVAVCPTAALELPATYTVGNPETGETVQTNLVGVYTLVGGRAEFKPVEILTEESDFYVVSPATEGRAVLRAGDEVIVRATGLYDGKLLNF